MQDRDVLREILHDTLQMYGRGKSRFVATSEETLDLRRFKGFTSITARAANLESVIERFIGQREFWRRWSKDRIASTIVSSLFLQYMIQNAPIYSDRVGASQWVLPTDGSGIDSVVDEFMAYVTDGVEFIHLKFPLPKPFFLNRPVGVPPPRIHLFDGMFVDCQNSVCIEYCTEQGSLPQEVIDDSVRRLENLVFSVSLAFPGYVVLGSPVLAAGRPWQKPPIHYKAQIVSHTLTEAEAHYEPAQKPAVYLENKRTTTTVRLPEDFELMQLAYRRVVDNLPRLSPQVRETLLRAWRRRLLASERRWHADRIMDYLVVLESLLLDARDELKFRTSLYAAHALGKSPDDRECVYRIVSKSYDLRSGIVHGGDPKVDKVADDCERVCLAMLMRFLEWGKPAKQVQQMLTKALVRGESIPRPGPETCTT